MKGKANKTLNSKYILLIYNILRDLGLKSSTTGTKIINKAVQIILIYDFDEFMNIQEVYKLVAQEFNSFTPNKVQSYINYAIKNRIEEIANIIKFEII